MIVRRDTAPVVSVENKGNTEKRHEQCRFFYSGRSGGVSLPYPIRGSSLSETATFIKFRFIGLLPDK